MDFLRAPALVLSCPGPIRRHNAALIPLAKLVLPQVLLGGESQCLAFAAAQPELAGRMFFAPAPEIFSDPASLLAAWRAVGETAHCAGEVVHLRFGSVRDSRILKGTRNAAVIAEAEGPPPMTASHHPFASGRVLPAAVQRLFVYGWHCLRPVTIGGSSLPAEDLPGGCLTADLEAAAGQKPARGRASGGLDLVRLAEYEADAWLSGEPSRPDDAAGGTRNMVLLPWNMAHYGSIVPELLARLATLGSDGAMPAVVLMPFNDPGPSGMIGALRKMLVEAAEAPDGVLKSVYLARVSQVRGLAKLKRFSRTVWVDGNDPEAWWTEARFNEAGFDTVRIPADEPIRIESATPVGRLHFDVTVTARRGLRALLAAGKPGGGAGRPA